MASTSLTTATVDTTVAATTKPSIDSVVVHPLVLLAVTDHYNRVAKDTRKRVIGVLLGENEKGRGESGAVPPGRCPVWAAGAAGAARGAGEGHRRAGSTRSRAAPPPSACARCRPPLQWTSPTASRCPLRRTRRTSASFFWTTTTWRRECCVLCSLERRGRSAHAVARVQRGARLRGCAYQRRAAAWLRCGALARLRCGALTSAHPRPHPPSPHHAPTQLSHALWRPPAMPAADPSSLLKSRTAVKHVSSK